MTPSPIALFAYNRPDHLRQALDALAANPEAARSELYVFSDAARNASSAGAVDEVRAVIAGIRGFSRVVPVLREANVGLAGSIIDGVGRLCQEHGRVVVLEDDLVVSPHFLAYMNDGLATYESDPEVASIHGYVYPVGAALPETFFLRGADCWGWATWSRAWKHFEPDGARLLTRLESGGLTHAFDFDGAYAYTAMLRDQIAGRNSSWAIRWHAAAFLADMVTLYPGRSLVQNIGNDGSGTHVDPTAGFDVLLSESRVRVVRQPCREDRAARAIIASHLRAERPTLRQRVWRRLHRAFGRASR